MAYYFISKRLLVFNVN